MRAHIIENGVIANTIEVESLDFMPGLIDASQGGSISDLWDGQGFSKPPRDKAKELAEKLLAIEAHRDKLLDAGGYKIDVPGKGFRWFASDPRSQRRQIALQVMGGSIPPGVVWRTLNNDKVTITQQVANLIFQAAAAQDLAIDAAAEAHKTAVQASADPAAYDFSTGWPETFK